MDSNKTTLIKQLKQNHNSQDVLASFYTTYRTDLLNWIRSQIYNESLKNDAEIILHEFFYSLLKKDSTNPFAKLEIFEDEKYLINAFNKYVKNTLIKRLVIKYIGNRGKMDNRETSLEETTQEDDSNTTNAQRRAELQLSEESHKHEKDNIDLNEMLKYFKSEYCKKRNQNRDFEICMKNVIDGFSIEKLAKEYGVSKNSISISIFRVKKKLRGFLKE